MEHITTDGGPQMMSDSQTAETTVKSFKRMLQDCASRFGSIDNDKFVKAILQYRNTPHKDCRRSPAQMVFGRTLRDHIP
jgi:hypothetical protein